MNTNKIRNKTYESICELCEDVVDTYESLNRFPSDESTMDISFIAKYNEAKEIISSLCKLEYDITFCQLVDPEYDGYIDEYIITIYDGEIWCEPFKREDEYIYDESNFLYILDNCNSKVLEKCDLKHIFEVSIEDEEYDDLCDDGCIFCKECNEDDDMHGFTATRNDDNGFSTLSFYSTEKLNSDEMRDLLEIFGL